MSSNGGRGCDWSGYRALPSQGEDVSEVMASVIKDEPDWKQLSAMHPGIQRLLKRCLQKEPKSRLRDMDRLEPMPISGTEGAYSSFFSPDGESVGFFDWNESKLKQVNLNGGVPVTLCDAPFGLGGSWGPEGSIIFTPDLSSTLWTISAAGGAPQALTERTLGESTQRWPEILPDGSAVLFTVWGGGSTARAHIMAFSLESNETKLVLEEASYAHYSPTGHLIYVRHHDLFAAPFDAKRLEIGGASAPILQDVGIDPSLGAAQYALSSNGSMAYVPFTPEASYRRLVWVDRQGEVEGVVGDWEEWGEYSFPRLSPDGKHLAVVRYGEQGKADIWVSDLVRGTTARLTFEGNNFLPLWTPDGKRMAFASDRNGTWNLFWKLADGSGSPEPLLENQYPQLPSSWSPDGKMLVFTQYHPSTGSDIWVLPMEGDSQAQPFLQSQFNEWAGVISPDGKW